MVCPDEMMPIYVVCNLILIAFELLMIIGKFRYNNAFGNVKSVTEDAQELNRVKSKYGAIAYYLSYLAVFIVSEMINHRYRTLLFFIVQLIIGINIFDAICLKPE